MTVRLLDFGSSNPFVGIFGRPRTLAWPVNTYRVTLPVNGPGSNTLNPFEQVVLGVLEAEPGRNLSDLAEVTCIPEGLVRSVLLRLRDKRLIDNDNRPPQQATPKPEDSQVQVVTAVVFQEALTGRLLPHIQILDEGSPLRFKTREDFKYHEGRVLRASSRPKSHARPSPKDVIAVLRQSRQRSAAFGGRVKLPELAQIRVAGDAESRLLDCPIAIQRSDADFRIADPFGNGFSLVLEEVLTALLAGDESLQQWMTGWRTSLTSADSGDSSRDRARQPFEAEPFRSRYPRLVTSLVPGRTLGYRSIAKIYASLEWALFYCVDARDAATAIEVLRLTRPDGWSERLSRAAEQVGLKVPAYGFRAIPQGRLADMLAGKAEMSTVLAATLVQAEHDEAHPLRKLAQRHPDLLLQIQEIREIRDQQEHGGATARQDGESRFDPLMCEWVTALIPGIRFDGPAAIAAGHQGTAEDRRLDARTAVIGQLGYALMYRLPASARDALVDAEQAWIAHQDDDDALPLVGRLYAALQAVTKDRLSGLPSVALPEQNYRNVATSRAEVAGFGRIPEALSSVRPERVRDAMFGNGSTLGACATALLLVLSDEQLVNLAAVQPSLLADIGAVISKRAHGNEPVPLGKSAAKSLRTSAINSIRTLMEA